MASLEKKDVCPYCKAERKFSLYAAAHWNELLTTKCDACGKKYDVRRGVSLKVRQK